MRCVSCGEVHWNLRLSSRVDAPSECRLCGSELRAERRPLGRRFERVLGEGRDRVGPTDPAGLGRSATS
ncbi:MAG: hypothetical protein QOH76_2475 [Thermoleophilaceae bacterium]|nr:hypothetical protein [Thermoleophilaceae bacterium]